MRRRLFLAIEQNRSNRCCLLHPLPSRRQLFYDDEHGNIRRVSTLGVCSILVSRRGGGPAARSFAAGVIHACMAPADCQHCSTPVCCRHEGALPRRPAHAPLLSPLPPPQVDTSTGVDLAALKQGLEAYTQARQAAA